MSLAETNPGSRSTAGTVPVIVGIGDCMVSDDPSHLLLTHALGSCIAVLVHDPVVKVSGLLHYMLPEASLDRDKAIARPFVFADTGIPMLFQSAYQLGAVKSRMVVMAVGGAQMLNDNGTFNIGKRNQLAMRKIFWRAGVIVRREEIGGSISRTVSIEVESGRVRLRSPGLPEQVLDRHAGGSMLGSVPGSALGSEAGPVVGKEGKDGLQHTHRR